jgi:hypothetical protein
MSLCLGEVLARERLWLPAKLMLGQFFLLSACCELISQACGNKFFIVYLLENMAKQMKSSIFLVGKWV